MSADTTRILGRTGIKVARLGVAAGYGAPASAFEEAFDKGCNYFYWGSLRKDNMRRAIENICGQGKRDALVIVLQSYSRSALIMESLFKKALKSAHLDYVDVLLMKEALKTLALGPLDSETLERMRKIGEHVCSRTKSFF